MEHAIAAQRVMSPTSIKSTVTRLASPVKVMKPRAVTSASNVQFTQDLKVIIVTADKTFAIKVL